MHKINEICGFIHNDFVARTIMGTFEIVDGSLVFPENANILDGQFFKIENSVLNDGIYQHPEDKLNDERFTGAVSLLRIPPEVIEIAEEIKNWEQENVAALNSPYQSESFGNYSFTKASGNTADGNAYSWREVFGNRLAKYRKIG
jgi:hypothetical protein